MGNDCGAVGRAVASDSRDPRFQSIHQKYYLLKINYIEKNEKRRRESPNFLKMLVYRQANETSCRLTANTLCFFLLSVVLSQSALYVFNVVQVGSGLINPRLGSQSASPGPEISIRIVNNVSADGKFNLQNSLKIVSMIQVFYQS